MCEAMIEQSSKGARENVGEMLLQLVVGAVTQNEDEARDEALERVPAHEQRDWLPLMQFFFEGHGDHRDLHSFPTRRSSDLRRRTRRTRPPVTPTGPAWRARCGGARTCSATARTRTSAPRSTSGRARRTASPPLNCCTARPCPTTTTWTRTRPGARPTTSPKIGRAHV